MIMHEPITLQTDLSNEEYFYLPVELFSEQKYKKYSSESKMLFSMILSSSEHTSSILEVSDLIHDYGRNNIRIALDNVKNGRVKVEVDDGGKENV